MTNYLQTQIDFIEINAAKSEEHSITETKESMAEKKSIAVAEAIKVVQLD